MFLLVFLTGELGDHTLRQVREKLEPLPLHYGQHNQKNTQQIAYSFLRNDTLKTQQ